MTLKSFLIGMLASFGLAWMCIIAIPVAKMASLPAVKMSSEEDAEYYQHQTSGRMLNGAEIYAANGCYTCHSQLIRPTYLGSQIFREDVAGVSNADGDSRRETPERTTPRSA
jgi:cytochrome c oxidase cbb3-type subunit 2